MKRIIGGGEAILAEMKEGQNGFLEYKWPGGDWLISEVPNLLLKAPKNELPEKSQVKPKSKAKGKAKAKGAKKALAKKPAGKAAAKAASKAAANAPEPLAKAAAKAVASTSDSSELVLHNLRITKASKPPRTYLTACTFGGPGPHKPRLIVEYSEKRDGVNHESKCHKAKEHIISVNLGYSAAREIRHVLPQ